MSELQITSRETITPYQAHLLAQRKLRLARFHVVQKPVASVVSDIIEINALEPFHSPILNAQIRVAQDAVRKTFGDRIAISEIKKTVAEHFGITVDGLIGPRRLYVVTWPRQIAMYLCKTLTSFSYPAVGRQFGGRDHATALHAERKVGALRESDPTFNAQIEAIIRKIKGED